MTIQFEKEVLDYLSLPSVPKKTWDGKSSFEKGVTVLTHSTGVQSYAVCTKREDEEHPSIVKVFLQEPFVEFGEVFVVPEYMDTNVEEMDLDEESKKAAERLAAEASELVEENNESKDDGLETLPEWIFPEIHNDEEAKAWLRKYNSSNGIKGRIPDNEETLKLRLLNIYSQSNKKKNA